MIFTMLLFSRHKLGYLAFILTLIFFAQDIFAQDPSTQKLSVQQSRVFTVGFAQDTLGNDWRKAQVNQLRTALARYPNIKLLVSDAHGSSAQQVRDIEDFAFRKVDLIITSPRDGRISTPAIRNIYRSGLPVVLITRKIASDDYTSLIAPDDRRIAGQAARFIADRLHGKGNIIMLKGVPTASTVVARTKGFLETLKKYPGLKLVATEDANYLRADAIRAMEKILAKGIKFDAIYAQSDSMASGARLALQKAGISPKDKLIVGIDYIREAQKAIARGEQAASFVYPTCAKEAAQVIVDILHGKKVKKYIRVESQMVTRKNINAVKPIF